MPWWRWASSAKSIIMMAFFFTMPINSKIPIIAITVRSWPNSIRVAKAPTAAEGKPAKMVSGWM